MKRKESLDRPFVVCHMISGLDGRIDGRIFDTAEMLPVREASDQIRKQLACDAVLCGASTTAEAYEKNEMDCPAETEVSYPRTDYIASSEAQNFYVSIDTEGRLRWPGKYIENRVQPKAHIIEVLTEDVADSYLDYLHRLDISYVFAGKKELNGTLLLKKLKQKFGIQRVMVSGGGITNWSFLKEGVIDELSLVLCPLAEGNREAAALFDQSSYMQEGSPEAFSLANVQTLPGDGLWLIYQPKNRREREDD